MPRYLLIVNPTSGRGFAGRSLALLNRKCKNMAWITSLS